ncbi:MAG: patatin-like phospholipase family protein [Bacillaceae bacterium]
MDNINKWKIGLVLAGGGAKGAYEAGVFKALSELELIPQITVISGTSIGIINGLMICMNDNSVIDKSWGSVSYSRFITQQNDVRDAKLSRFGRTEKNASFFDLIKSSDIGLLSQSGIRDFIREYIDFSVVKASNKTLYACAYNVDLNKPTYFKLNDYNEEEMMDIVLASCAIPYIFKPIQIREYRYADGGINNPQYTKQNTDNVPIRPLKHHNCNIILVVHLSYRQQIDKQDFEGCPIIELYPSMKLETITGIGTLNLSQSTLQQHVELGYRDAMCTLAPILLGLLKGKPLAQLLERHEQHTIELVSKINRLL